MAKNIILDLCGGTGAWSKPYKEAGYDVRLITLPDYDVTKVEFRVHCMAFIRQGVEHYEPMLVLYKDVYGILAAPPCTEFSFAKNGGVTDRAKHDFNTGLQTVEACQRIIWEVRKHSKIAFWALENPVGYLRQFLGKPPLTFYQWWYGDNGLKRTDLWGYYNMPTRTVFDRPETAAVKRYPCGSTNAIAWDNPPLPDWLEGKKLTRADRRAITPEGFANAFFRANR